MKRMFRSLLLIAVSLFFSGGVFSSPGTAADIVQATLKNDLRVVIIRHPLAPVVSTMVNYLVGSNEAPSGFPGMAHAQEHMMFRGCPGLSGAQLATLIAAMGGRFDADTQQTVTQYFFTVPAEDLDVALKIEALRMQDVLDSEGLWDQERGAIEQEVAQDLSNPMYVFYVKLLGHLFEGTPYAHDALGTRSSFGKTTGTMLKSFYTKWYRPNNAIMVIVGDIEPERTLEVVRGLFEDIPSKSLPARNTVRLRPLKAATIEQETDLPYGLAIVAYRFPGYRDPDFAAAQVLADALDSERGDLSSMVAAGEALEAGFTVNLLPEAGLGYAFAAFPPGADGQRLIARIKAIIEGYVQQGVPPELVAASKNHELADSAFRKESIEGLAAEWSMALAVEGRSSPADDMVAIKKVTPADVQRAARTYLITKTAIVGLLKPHATGRAKASHTFRGRESFAPQQTEPVTLPEWAKEVMAPAGIPPSRVNPAVSVLSNGLRLIVQRETISPTVSMYGEVKHNADLQTPKGREGVEDVLEDLFSYGTTTLDRLDFQKAVDDIAARISVGTSFSLQVLKDHFERGVELIADNLLRPGLPERAFKVVRQETAQLVAGRMSSPRHLSRRALLKALYPKGDPTLRQPTPESVAALSLDDVRNFHKEVFRPDLTVIVVIGDVRAEEARAVVEKYFGGWQATGPKPETDLPAVPLNKGSETAVPDASRVQDAVILAETLGLTRAHPDYYALQVGNHVLSGAFYATRLYRDLREKTGLVYAVESVLEADKTRSSFQVFYACEPPNVSRARQLVEQNLRSMQTTPVSQRELEQAKTLLVCEIPLGESSYDGIGESLLRLALLDLPLDEPSRAAKRYLTISAEEVRAAFGKWIRPQGFVQVTLGPRPD